MTSNWLYATYVKQPIRFYDDPKPIDEPEDHPDSPEDVVKPQEPVPNDVPLPDIVKPVDNIPIGPTVSNSDENGPFLILMLVIVLIIWFLFHHDNIKK